MPPTREFRPRSRTSAVRDARLIVIACEGSKTEVAYFRELASLHHNPRVHVEPLPPSENQTSPQHVLERLSEFRRQYRTGKQDELWVVIDVDRWGAGKLSQVAQACLQKRFSLAVSNPCFELWLLLHLKDLSTYSQTELDELLSNAKSGSRTRLEQELVLLCGSYSKSKPLLAPFLPSVEAAIARAKAADPGAAHRWPPGLGSRVYLVAESVIRK